jgi:hypothetical protein
MQNKEKSIALKTMEDGPVLLYAVSFSFQYPDVFINPCMFMAKFCFGGKYNLLKF